MAFIRQLMQRGDPLGILASTGFPTRRKQAGGGTMQKAARHRAVRMSRLVGMGDPLRGMSTISGGALTAMAKAGQTKKGFDVSQFLKGVGSATSTLLGGAKKVLGTGALGPLGSLVGSVLPGGAPNTRPATAFGPLPGAPDLSAFTPGGLMGGGAFGGGGGGGRRRHMNPLNVKALRRGLNRVAGFQRVVNRVNQLLPAGARRKAGGTFPKRKRRK